MTSNIFDYTALKLTIKDTRASGEYTPIRLPRARMGKLSEAAKYEQSEEREKKKVGVPSLFIGKAK